MDAGTSMPDQPMRVGDGEASRPKIVTISVIHLAIEMVTSSLTPVSELKAVTRSDRIYGVLALSYQAM